MKSILKIVAAVSVAGLSIIILYAALIGISINSEQFEEHVVRRSVGSQTVKMIGARGTGTGFFVKNRDSNILVTNEHVCRLKFNDNTLKAKSQSTGLTTSHTILFVSDKADICILTGDGDDHGLEVADDAPTAGDKAYVVGHPSGQPLTVTKGTFIGDTIIYLDKHVPTIIDGVEYNLPMRVPFQASQFHVYSRPGSSGSSITNSNRELVALLFAGNVRDQFKTYAVTLFEIKQAIDEYEKQQ